MQVLLLVMVLVVRREWELEKKVTKVELMHGESIEK
jgi:hypothetical protein